MSEPFRDGRDDSLSERRYDPPEDERDRREYDWGFYNDGPSAEDIEESR